MAAPPPRLRRPAGRPRLERARFRKANPDHRLGKPFLYVGMTGLDPDLRFDTHKAGIQANRFVQAHGLRLVPKLYEVYNPSDTQPTPMRVFRFFVARVRALRGKATNSLLCVRWRGTFAGRCA